MADSSYKVEIVPVVLEPHPNADSLSIVRVFGFTVCVRTADWIGREIGAYIQPESVVDSTRPDFAFLARHERIKVKKLRGVISMGLLMPAPEGSKIGDDVAEILGVTHYEPPLRLSGGGEAIAPPPGYKPVFDVEGARRYARDVMIPNESVIVTEKVHGANGRWSYDRSSDLFYCGSRTEWKKEAEGNIWWMALEQCEPLRDFLVEHPDVTVYGEVYGKVQDLKYGIDQGVRVAVFDLLRGTEWVPALPAREQAPHLPWVPTIYQGAYDWDTIEALAEGPSLIPGANHMREGVVFKPLVERQDVTIGRVCLKIVGNGYLER